MKKEKEMNWTEECKTSFQELKAYLANPPHLVSPLIRDTLYLYLAITDHVVSSRWKDLPSSLLYEQILIGTHLGHCSTEDTVVHSSTPNSCAYRLVVTKNFAQTRPLRKINKMVNWTQRVWYKVLTPQSRTFSIFLVLLFGRLLDIVRNLFNKGQKRIPTLLLFCSTPYSLLNSNISVLSKCGSDHGNSWQNKCRVL